MLSLGRRISLSLTRSTVRVVPKTFLGAVGHDERNDAHVVRLAVAEAARERLLFEPLHGEHLRAAEDGRE